MKHMTYIVSKAGKLCGEPAHFISLMIVFLMEYTRAQIIMKYITILQFTSMIFNYITCCIMWCIGADFTIFNWCLIDLKHRGSSSCYNCRCCIRINDVVIFNKIVITGFIRYQSNTSGMFICIPMMLRLAWFIYLWFHRAIFSLHVSVFNHLQFKLSYNIIVILTKKDRCIFMRYHSLLLY